MIDDAPVRYSTSIFRRGRRIHSRLSYAAGNGALEAQLPFFFLIGACFLPLVFAQGPRVECVVVGTLRRGHKVYKILLVVRLFILI